MRAVRGPEGVVDIHVAQRGQLLRERGIVLLFLGVVAQVLQQQHFAGLGQHGFDFRTDAIRRHRHRLFQKSREALGARGQAHLRIRLALGTAEMARQDQRGAVVERVLDAGQRRLDALVAGNLFAAGGEGNVEIDPHEDAFVTQIQVANGKCAHFF